MTYSTTGSTTFTLTDARYIAAKLGADLRNLNARFGAPAIASIDDFVEETALYLKAGYLDTVDFGFKDGQAWILRLRYTAVAGGQLLDSAPGGLPRAIQISGYPFHSYLTPNSAFRALTAQQRAAFRATLPISRGEGPEPTTAAGTTQQARQYSRNGAGLGRDIYHAL